MKRCSQVYVSFLIDVLNNSYLFFSVGLYWLNMTEKHIFMVIGTYIWAIPPRL